MASPFQSAGCRLRSRTDTCQKETQVGGILHFGFGEIQHDQFLSIMIVEYRGSSLPKKRFLVQNADPLKVQTCSKGVDVATP
jgi:hypothetical protein